MKLERPFPAVDMGSIKSRCTECDGCLLWDGPMDHGPKIYISRVTYKVRLLVWQMAHGTPAPRSKLPMPTVCGEDRCVEPSHLRLVKRNAHSKGKKIPLAVRNRIAQTKRATVGKITMEIANSIRQPGMTLEQCAQAHKISFTNAQLIRANKAWIDYSNPYLQLAGAA